MHTHEIRKVLPTELDPNLLNPVDEAYVGTSPTLEMIVEKLHQLRSNISIFNFSSTDPVVLEINRLFEKQFGMDMFALKIDGDPYLNAFTQDIGRRLDMDGKKMSDYVIGNQNTGYRYAPGNGLIVIVHISVEMLADQRFSDRQIMAVILHEIGHNFADCIYDKLMIENEKIIDSYKRYLAAAALFYSILACTVIGTPAGIYGLVKLKQLKDTLSNDTQMKKEKKLQSKPRSSRVVKFFQGIAGKFKATDYFLTNVIYRMLFNKDIYDTVKAQYTKKDKEKIKNSIDRRNEVIADKFPAIYGFGVDAAEMHVTLRDITNHKEYKTTERFGKFAQRQNDIYEESMFDINDFDCHPNAVQRIHVTMNTLNSELAKEDLDPKVKKEIKAQLAEMQETLDAFLDASTKVKSIEKAQALYFQWVNNNAPDAINKNIEENIEAQLDAALERDEKNHK